MANNQYINKVVYNNNTLIDITDTTAVESDVAQGVVFYKADGSRAVGTAQGGSGMPEFTIKGTITPSVSGGSITASNLQYALTSDRTIGMIWGWALVKGEGGTAPYRKTKMSLGGMTVAQQTTDKQFVGNVVLGGQNQSVVDQANNFYTEVDTNGAVSLYYSLTTNTVNLMFIPVILRFSDF